MNARFLWMRLIGFAICGPHFIPATLSLPGAILIGYCLFSKD